MNDINKEICFEKVSGLNYEKIEDELLIYDLTDNKVHSLNGTAAFIWLSCDGTRTINDILKEIKDEFPEITSEKIEIDVREALEQLLELSLLHSKNDS